MSKFPLVIAHRGASSIAPENTIPAFKKACELSSDGFECDVHLSKDGELVVIHDSTLDRTTNGSGKVCDYTLIQLKKLDAGIKFSEKYKGTTIPTLEETIEFAVLNNLLIEIELKDQYKDIEEKTISLINKYKYSKNTIVTSFNKKYLRNIKKIDKNIQTELDSYYPILPLFYYKKILKVDVICPSFYYLKQKSKAYIKLIKFWKLKLNTFTLDTKEEMLEAINLGVDGILTNKPDVLIQLKDISNS